MGPSEWLDTSALLSPWKLAATTIEVQFSLKQMGERLALGTPHTRGNTQVDKLISTFLHHHMSTEEADFVAEMARGVGPAILCKVGLAFLL
jgi:mediator of RNA polymerase II transcription subunit 12, fungi type